MFEMPKKTLIKGTILISAFSIFLKIDARTIDAFLEFLGISYLFLILYILYKSSKKVTVTPKTLQYSSFMIHKSIRIEDINDYFSIKGFLQRKFGLNSIYIITKRGNFIFKDLKNGEEKFVQIREAIESYKNSVTPTSS